MIGKAFDKSSSNYSYTKRVYTITKIGKNSYYLNEQVNPFRGYELVKAVDGEVGEKLDKKAKEEQRDKTTIKRRLHKEGLE